MEYDLGELGTKLSLLQLLETAGILENSKNHLTD